MVQPAAPRAQLSTKLYYGFGSIAYGVKDSGFNTFLLVFYNQVVGLPPQWVSLTISIALIVDAFSDPLIGEISDNWRSRLGRRHPFMYFSAAPVAILFFLLWNPPAWSPGALLGWLLGCAILLRICIACYEIPNGALLAELTPDYDQRTSFLSYRFFFGVLGGGAMTFGTLGLLFKPTAAQPVGMLLRAPYFYYGLIGAAAMAASILISAVGTHRFIPTFRKVPPTHHPTLGQIAREVYATLSNRNFLNVTIASLFSAMAAGLATGLTTYFGIYFWKFSSQQLAVVGAAGALAAVLGLILAPLISARFGKRPTAISLAITSVLVGNITMVLKLLGMLPPDGSNALLAVFFASTVISASVVIAALIIITSMLTDIVEDSELKTGRRSEGLFSAAGSFIQKTISGIGIFFAGLLLAFVHFPAHASQVTIDPHIVRNLVLIYMPVHIALIAISIAFFSRYRIDKSEHEETLRQLAASAAIAQPVIAEQESHLG